MEVLSREKKLEIIENQIEFYRIAAENRQVSYHSNLVPVTLFIAGGASSFILTFVLKEQDSLSLGQMIFVILALFILIAFLMINLITSSKFPLQWEAKLRNLHILKQELILGREISEEKINKIVNDFEDESKRFNLLLWKKKA